jgi:hypothetical protein
MNGGGGCGTVVAALAVSPTIYLTEFIPALEMPVNPDVWLPQHRRFSFHVMHEANNDER